MSIEIPDWVVREVAEAMENWHNSPPSNQGYNDAMRAALRAALGAWVAQRGKTYYDTRDSSLPTQVDWNNPEPGAKENVYTLRQEKPE